MPNSSSIAWKSRMRAAISQRTLANASLIDGTAQYLIRPDGQIGYRCGGDDLAGLQRYLGRWLPNATSRPA